MRSLVVCLCLCSPAVGAPELLIEFAHTGGIHVANGTPMLVSFSASSVVGAELGGLRLPADLGNVYTASPEALAAFQAALTTPGSRLRFESASTFPDLVDVENLWAVSPPVHLNLTAIYLAPQLGLGLAGYTITEITQTIDSIFYHSGASTIVGEASQTLRIYGELATVPEPSAILLMLFGICAGLITRRRKPASQDRV